MARSVWNSNGTELRSSEKQRLSCEEQAWLRHDEVQRRIVTAWLCPVSCRLVTALKGIEC